MPGRPGEKKAPDPREKIRRCKTGVCRRNLAQEGDIEIAPGRSPGSRRGLLVPTCRAVLPALPGSNPVGLPAAFVVAHSCWAARASHPLPFSVPPQDEKGGPPE